MNTQLLAVLREKIRAEQGSWVVRGNELLIWIHEHSGTYAQYHQFLDFGYVRDKRGPDDAYYELAIEQRSEQWVKQIVLYRALAERILAEGGVWIVSFDAMRAWLLRYGVTQNVLLSYLDLELLTNTSTEENGVYRLGLDHG